jgi:hypothetical protein
MTYFGRLVEQSHLMVGGTAGHGRAVAEQTAALSLPIGPGGVTDGDAADLLQITEVVEAPASPDTVSPNAAPTSSGVGMSRTRAEHTPTPDSFEAHIVSPSTEASRHREPSPIVDASPYEIAMRRVLEWVAAGPQPGKPPSSVTEETPGVEERVVTRVMAPRPATATAPDDDIHVDASTPAERDIPMHAIVLPVRIEQEPQTVTSKARGLAAAELGARAPVAPISEDGVQVSIGSISVRVEAPAAPAPTVPALPPRAVAPTAQAPPGSERSTRLARRYLHL